MAQKLQEWLDQAIRPAQKLPVREVSENFFFRDPIRGSFSDSKYFTSPADGVILYQRELGPTDPLMEIKGVNYTLQHALRDKTFNEPCLVIGVFMTLYDVHVNRVPYPGRLSYRELPPLESRNRPMIDIESDLYRGKLNLDTSTQYLHTNQRIVSKVYSHALRGNYYMLQIADYDVSCILPYHLEQRQFVRQGERFSQIRFGSQVDLIVPMRKHYQLRPSQAELTHVQGALDPLIEITFGRN